MTDAALTTLAEAAGVAPRWRDVHGGMHDVAPPTLRSVLAALGLPAGTDGELADSRAMLGVGNTTLPPLLTAEAGCPTPLPVASGRFRLVLEDGAVQDGMTDAVDGRATLPPLQDPGYHRLEIGDQATILAVAPSRCFSVNDAAPGTRPWGIAAQLYSLSRPGDGGLGDFGALRDFVRAAAKHRADAVAISPVHAQFSADPDRFSPYSPSSRMLLNVLHAEVALHGSDDPARPERTDFVDWPAATRHRLAALRRAYETVDSDTRTAFGAFRVEQSDALETHARFEALHSHFFHDDPACWHWRTWPEPYRDPRSPDVAAFAHGHENEVGCYAFMQFLADRSLGDAQRAARDAGMAFGLIADLAVGADSGGSHCWSRQAETLSGVTIGAPPDLLNPHGQSWGLAAFSPRGLALNGFAAYLEMLRAAMRHAGGVRIDHVMGLARLWVVPDGTTASEGAYIHFPLDDMLRLIALESVRHRAIVLGEDLGTVPDGFQERLIRSGVMGLRVLWFERNHNGFTPPGSWSRSAAAMTSTHDLPTVAGWWSGRDLEWRAKLNLLGDDAQVAHEHEIRAQDRASLWGAFCSSSAAEGDCPASTKPETAVDAAVRHVGHAACDLMILPVEDALALPEQPNLPGTLHEHPNWQRRLPGLAREVLDEPAVAARLRDLNRLRTSR